MLQCASGLYAAAHYFLKNRLLILSYFDHDLADTLRYVLHLQILFHSLLSSMVHFVAGAMQVQVSLNSHSLLFCPQPALLHVFPGSEVV